MVSRHRRCGMEPCLSKGSALAIERWHQVNVLLQQMQHCLARGERAEAAGALCQAIEISPATQRQLEF